MSESAKPRFAVDLNDIERQLAHASAPPVQPAPATRNDPLAELARIVGQDDPFQSILASDGSTRPRQQPAAIDDLFATRDTMTPTYRQAHVSEVRGRRDVPAYDLDQYPQVDVGGADSGYAYQPAASAHGQQAYGNEDYAQDYYDENAGHYGSHDYGQPERLDYPPVEKPRSRKGLIAIGAIVGAAAIGLGGAYMFGSSSTVSNGQPPLIKAGNEPIKVQPQNPGGVEIPNQNKQIYERAGNTETKVVNREEQPVDVKQAVRMNGGAVADATGASAPASPARAAQPAYGLNLGEPRKVRTVTIRPDGSVVQPGGDNQQAAPSPVPTMTLPAEARPAPAVPAAQSPTQVAAVQPKPVASVPVAAPAPKPAPAPAPVASPAPEPQKVASTQPVPLASPEPEPATAPVGGFAVQLGLANSESGAETAFAQFQRKYSDLEGLPLMVRKAEVNGNTIYRVRVGPMSREDASSLCSRLQGQGGQCFVAKN